MAEPTFSGTILHRIQLAIAEQGLDAQSILESSEYADLLLAPNRDDIRVSHKLGGKLWQNLEQQSGDTNIGLHTGAGLDFHSAMPLEYLFVSSPTFGEALQICEPYVRLISDALDIQHHIEGDTAVMRFSFQFGKKNDLRHLNEMTGAAFIRFFRFVTAQQFQASAIGFEHDAPEQQDEHQRIFHCDPSFAEKDNFIAFPASLLELPCPLPQPQVSQAHVEVVNQQMNKLREQDFLASIKEVIGSLLSEGEVTLEAVADRLTIKPARLRYMLSEMDTSFSELLANYRSKLAKDLLAKTETSIDQIIYLTGFSEASPFYRAFKRWTSMTPIAYREKFRVDS